jgi:hypothetical protein
MIAHVTYAGGGLVLPADTPYDRQLLRENVLDTVRREGKVRISVGKITWMVERPSEDRFSGCHACKRQLLVAALHASGTDTTFCATCALCDGSLVMPRGIASTDAEVHSS